MRQDPTGMLDMGIMEGGCIGGPNYEPVVIEDRGPEYHHFVFLKDMERTEGISVDPLVSKYLGWSLYNFTMNSPLNLVHTKHPLEQPTSSETVATEDKPHVDSFKFEATSQNSDWQEAATVGLYFEVALVKINPKNVEVEYLETIEFEQPVLFGVPSTFKFDGRDLTPELAAEITSQAVSDVMAETSQKFAGTKASPMEVRQYFRTQLIRQYSFYIPGGRVQFNAMHFNVTTSKFRHSWW